MASDLDELRDLPVEKYGRGLYWVGSKSRYRKRHLVDIEGYEKEPFICTCEAFFYHGHRPCHHIRACVLFIIENEMTVSEVDALLERINPKKPKRTYQLNNETHFTKKNRSH